MQDVDGSAPIGNVSRHLTVAKLLIEDFVSIGYADALQSDENLRSLIFGSSALPSGQDITESFADVFRLPIQQRHQKAQAALQKMNIQPSQEAFVKAVKDLNHQAIYWFLELGYWNNMSQTERAALMRLAALPSIQAFGRSRLFARTYRMPIRTNQSPGTGVTKRP